VVEELARAVQHYLQAAQIQQLQAQDLQQLLHTAVVLVQQQHHQLMEHLILAETVAAEAVVVEIKLAQELQLLVERVYIQEVHSSVQQDKVMMAEAELV